MTVQFQYLVRGVNIVDGKVLLAHQIGATNTFLPGGYVEGRERADVASVREIHDAQCPTSSSIDLARLPNGHMNESSAYR